MTDLPDSVEAFLASIGWATAKRATVAGDMSSRRYYRLTRGESSAILMVAETTQAPFLRMTEWLDAAGLAVPHIFDAQPDNGLILMEDFGSRSVKSIMIEDPQTQPDLFEDCVALLLQIRAADPPDLPALDAETLVAWTRLADDHYPGVSTTGLEPFRATLHNLLTDALEIARTVSLRDFHSENMMWLPERTGHLRLGLLDYQDAFLTHPAYDLMSLLTDARMWIPADIRALVLDRYLQRSGDQPDSFKTAFAALSAQRNLRILGIFARAGKHMNHLPNTYRYFREALDHPAFDAVREETLAAIPAPGTL